MSEPAPMAHRIALLRTSTDDELRRLLESIDKIRSDASTERTQKERLALELARADEERERLTKELEEARKPREMFAILERIADVASRLAVAVAADMSDVAEICELEDELNRALRPWRDVRRTLDWLNNKEGAQLSNEGEAG